MIKSSTTTQELRLQRPGQSPTTMDSLKTSFLPNLSMDTADVLNALYCPMCGQQCARHQQLAEHMQICHHASAGIMLHAPIIAPPPPPASLKIEYPCLSCDDKFTSAQELDEHNRIAHQPFLARCLSCGLYGISSTSLQEGSAGGQYKCMHCGAVCSAAALAGQQAYLEQQTSFIESTSSQSQEDDMEREREHQQHRQQQQLHHQQHAARVTPLNEDDDDEEEDDEELPPQLRHPPEVIVQLKVPPLTVKLPKNSDTEHPHVIIKQEPSNTSSNNSDANGNGNGNGNGIGNENICDRSGMESPDTPDSIPVYTIQQTGNASHTSVVVSASSTVPAALAAATGAIVNPNIVSSMIGGGNVPGVNSVANAKVRHKCPECPKTFKTPGTLAMHKKVHTGEAE